MNDIFLAGGSCFLAGVLTTAHPCPFTTNLAAISLLAGMSADKGRAVSITIYFVFGYLTSILLLAFTLSTGILSIPFSSIILQQYINLFMGPMLIIAGMLQANLLNTNAFNNNKIFGYILSGKSGFRALPLGFLFALSFCPATAAIFFGLLIPMAVEYEQNLLFPSLYALGASLPVIAVGIMVSGSYFPGKRNKWRRYFPLITGSILIITGIYISISRIFLG